MNVPATPSTPPDLLKTASAFWLHLKSQAGLSIFYDAEILNGNGTIPGLYSNLGIFPAHSEFEDDLAAQSISVEQLIVAFFKTLAPYSRMMSDLCSFFQKHHITESNESLRISFDFGAAGGEGLEFDLQHFREVLEKYTRSLQLLGYLNLTDNYIWRLRELFGDDYNVKAANPAVRRWVEKYRDTVDPEIMAPEIELPPTGNSELDLQLHRVLRIWKSFVNTCRSLSTDVDHLKTLLRPLVREGSKDNYWLNTQPWDAWTLAWAESDFWPQAMLESMFHKLEQLSKLAQEQKVKDQNELSESIREFLDSLTEARLGENELIKELIDVLQLPVWKKRYELYAAWVLSVIDEVLSVYPPVFHHTKGKLVLSFSPRHLATFETADGPAELWSEVRSPLSNPSGKGRKKSINQITLFPKTLPINPRIVLLE